MRFTSVSIFLAVILASCASPQLASSTPILTPTFSLEPTSTAIYTPILASTTIPTQTPFPNSAVKQLIQENYSIIQPENVNSIYQLVRYSRFKIQSTYLRDIVEDVAFSPNKYVLAFGSGNGAGLWDLGIYLTQPSLVEGNPIDISQNQVDKVSFSPDGQFVAASGSSEMQILDLNSHKFLFSPWVKPVYGFAFSPNGAVICMANGNLPIWNWHGTSIHPERYIEMPPEHKPPKAEGHNNTSITFSPDGKLIASGVEFFNTQQGFVQSVIFLWNFETGQVINVLGKNNKMGDVNSLSFNPEGNLLVSGGSDGKVRLWDVKNGDLLSTLECDGYRTYTVAFSPDGRIFAAGCQDGTIRIWDTKALKLIQTIQAHTVRTTKITFSFDGRFIASSGYDGDISLWGVYAP